MRKMLLMIATCAFAHSANADTAEEKKPLTNFHQIYETEKYTTPNGAVITGYNIKGNLEITHELDCIPLTSAKNAYTPPDLYNAVAKCIRARSFENSVELFLLAGAYVRFDAMRVADKTAHQARTVLIMNYTHPIPKQLREEWAAYVNKSIPGSEERNNTCKKIKEIGAPAYYPTYMIRHGTAYILSDTSEPIVKDFDPVKAWEKILTSGLSCEN